MRPALVPAVRPARPSRSRTLLLVMLAPAVLAGAGIITYAAGFIDGELAASRIRRPLAPPAATAPVRAVDPPVLATTVINVAPGVANIDRLVDLRPGEEVVAIDGARTSSPELVLDEKAPGHYVDITTTERRIVVLVH